MFPYTHMTRTELIDAGKDAGGLAQAIASQLEEVSEELEGHEADMDAEEKAKRDAEQEAEHATNLLEETRGGILLVLESIPEKTTHKGLIAIREALTGLKEELEK